MSEFEEWFKTTSAYRMLESMNYYKMDLFHWIEVRGEYRHTSVQIAFMTWVEQQAKIDLLENEIVETQEFLNKQNHIKQAKIDEMQKRIDGALGIAQITISGKGNSVAIATCMGLAREIEKALRGGDQNTKNKAQSIENTGHEGGDQKALRGEHANS